jgi:ferritin-like metal-binding protein YciE
MPTKTVRLDDLFLDMLKDIYYAEKKILKALPKMSKALSAASPLARAFSKHYSETLGQVERLEKVFSLIGKKPQTKKCEAIEGLTKEADELMDTVSCQATLEAGLLAAAQAVEHYEIARYGTLVEWAKMLGYTQAVDLLDKTLSEEKKTDLLLTDLAVDGINVEAMQSYENKQNNKAA